MCPSVAARTSRPEPAINTFVAGINRAANTSGANSDQLAANVNALPSQRSIRAVRNVHAQSTAAAINAPCNLGREPSPGTNSLQVGVFRTVAARPRIAAVDQGPARILPVNRGLLPTERKSGGRRRSARHSSSCQRVFTAHAPQREDQGPRQARVSKTNRTAGRHVAFHPGIERGPTRGPFRRARRDHASELYPRSKVRRAARSVVRPPARPGSPAAESAPATVPGRHAGPRMVPLPLKKLDDARREQPLSRPPPAPGNACPQPVAQHGKRQAGRLPPSTRHCRAGHVCGRSQKYSNDDRRARRPIQRRPPCPPMAAQVPGVVRRHCHQCPSASVHSQQHERIPDGRSGMTLPTLHLPPDVSSPASAGMRHCQKRPGPTAAASERPEPQYVDGGRQQHRRAGQQRGTPEGSDVSGRSMASKTTIRRCQETQTPAAPATA